MYYTLLFLTTLIVLSCHAQKSKVLNSNNIILNNLRKDSVIFFLNNSKDTLNIYREIEIIENDNQDSLLIGYSVIPPKFTGKIWFLQSDLNSSSAVYIDKTKGLDIDNPSSFAKLFTIQRWNKNYESSFNKIKIRVQLK